MHYTIFLKMWKLKVQELVRLHENWCWTGKGIIRLGLQLVKWVKKKTDRGKEIYCPQQPRERKL